MPNKKAKERKMDRKRKNLELRQYKREQKRLKKERNNNATNKNQ